MTRGDIVLINLPQVADNAGHEQEETRPALVVHEDASSTTLSVVMIVPFTSNLKARRFRHTIIIQPSQENGLSTLFVLLVFQLRAIIDKQRVSKKVGHLEDELMGKVNQELKELLGLVEITSICPRLLWRERGTHLKGEDVVKPSKTRYLAYNHCLCKIP